MKNFSKKILATVLALVMLAGVVPFAAFAGSDGTSAQSDGASAFRRIVHIDCGRRYFTADEIKTVIDYAAEIGYTHVELAFGNDGLRFLLNDMSLTANGKNYDSDAVAEAVKQGNKSYGSSAGYNPTTGELTEDEMNGIIDYAKKNGVGIIPMFDAPGHLYAVIKAMGTLEVTNTSFKASFSGTSENRALYATNTEGLNFVKALQEKYMAYFASKGCMYYNFAADECGFNTTEHTMTSDEYTAYVEFANSLAKSAKAYGLIPMMFNDGAYNPKFTSKTELDTDIVICYWDAGSGTKYAQASALANKGFEIINTQNKWYYVPSAQDSGWYGHTWATNNMQGKNTDEDCNAINCKVCDGDDGSTEPAGCMVALWLDTPSTTVDMLKVKTWMKTLATNGTNDDVFKGDKGTLWKETSGSNNVTKLEISVNGETASESELKLENGDEATLSVGEVATWTVADENVVTLESADTESTALLSLDVSAKSVKINAVDKGTTTVTAKTATQTATLSVTVAETENNSGSGSETTTVEKKIDLTVGETKTDVQEDVNTAGSLDKKELNEYISSVTAENTNIEGGTQTNTEKVTSIESGKEYYISDGKGNWLTNNSTNGVENATSAEAAGTWTVTSNNRGGYLISREVDGSTYYLQVNNNNNSFSLVDNSYQAKTFYYDSTKGFYYTTNSGWSSSTYYLTNVNGNWTVATQSATKSHPYTVTTTTTDPEYKTTVTFTGAGEGTTYATVGDVKYKIVVTAPNKSDNKTLNVGTSMTLPDGATDIKVTSGDEYITVSETTVTAGEAVGTAVITFVTKNAGDNITAKYTYTVKVTDVDLSGVSPIALQLWITNTSIEATGENAGSAGNASSGYNTWNIDKRTNNGVSYDNGAGYIKVPAELAYRENGIDLETALQGNALVGRTEWGGKRYADHNVDTTKDEYKFAFWKALIHNNDNIQKSDPNDYSDSGEEFKFIRYWDGKWEVSSDRESWTSVKDIDKSGATGTYNNCSEQLAVYYMQRTDVTKEVTTDIADWGKPKSDETEYNNQVNNNSESFVLLDFAVKYESGDRVSESFPVDKTLAYHCSSGSSGVINGNGTYYRQLNNIRAVDTDDYEVYMVTVTMTDDSASETLTSDKAQSDYEYSGEEQIVWAIDEETHQNCGLSDYVSISGESSVYSGCKVGGEAYIRGVEVYAKHGALITYYVRAKVKKSNLKVHYIDKTNDYKFYSYDIVVTDGEKFKESVKLPENKLGSLENGTVTNSLGKEQTVTSDIREILAVPAQYRLAKTIKCVDLVKNGDLTELSLYYTFENDYTFVADFGLPVVIEPKNLDVTDKIYSVNATSAKLNWGTITVGEEDYSITYKPEKFMNLGEMFTVTYTVGENSEKISKSIQIIPASTVYYEDSFVATANGTGAASGAQWETVNDDTETKEAQQALSELGARAVYGYDEAYANCTEFSMGSAKKVTVKADMANNWKDSSDSAWPTATFTFEGTGFDVISLTNNDSGVVIYTVENAETKESKSYFVNNYYGYKFENGKWSEEPVGNDIDNTIYQIPVIRVDNLEYGTYTVTLTVSYGEYFDKTGDEAYSFWLDAVRIYNPLGKDYAEYTKDNEGYPQFIELHDELVNRKADSICTIEGTTNATLAQYEDIGPNHEVYLAKDQTLAFKLSGDNVDKVFLAAKSLDGNVTFNIGNGSGNAYEPFEVNTATDMYYDITGYAKGENEFKVVTVTNTSEKLLSLTYVKVTFNPKGDDLTVEEIKSHKVEMQTSEADKVQAVYAVRSMYAAMEAAENAFEPERFEAAYAKVGNTVKVTVRTSTDVSTVSVNGEKVTSYKTKYDFASKEYYREFTFTDKTSDGAEYTVVAIDANGVGSEPIAAEENSAFGYIQNLLNIIGKWF